LAKLKAFSNYKDPHGNCQTKVANFKFGYRINFGHDYFIVSVHWMLVLDNLVCKVPLI